MKRVSYALAMLVSLLTVIPALCGEFQVQRLSDRVLVIRGPEIAGEDSNITALATEKGLVVIDTNSAPSIMREERKIIEKEFGRKDFLYVISTHHHYDHVQGNPVFPETVIIAHDHCPAAMEAAGTWLPYRRNIAGARQELEAPSPDSPEPEVLRARIDWWEGIHKELEESYEPLYPALTFSDRLTLELGDLTARLIYYGRAHTESDILVHVPEENLVCVGDLFIHGYFPLIRRHLEEVEITRWISVLDEVLGSNPPVKHIVSGHGPLIDPDEIRTWRVYIEGVYEGLKAAQAAGLSLEDAQERMPMEEKFPAVSALGIPERRVEMGHETFTTFVWGQFVDSASLLIEETLNEKGIEAAVVRFGELRKIPSTEVYLSEGEMNMLGYRYFMDGNLDEAVAVFEMNAAAFPDSWNVHDSLGEAYMEAGKTREAIRCYEKSLELNPENDNGRQVLKRLQTGKEAGRKEKVME